MDAATIHAKIYAGRAKAALRLGIDYNVMRPLSAASPMSNQVTMTKVAFNVGDSNYSKPNLYGDALWYADLDGRLTQAGDYLVHPSAPSDVKFIAAQQLLLPVVCIDCNRSVRVSRQATTTAVGTVGYSGTTGATEINILGGVGMWPASILFGGKQQVGLSLPAGAKQSGWRILLPPSVPATVVIGASDIVTDDIGRRYLIDGAELTDLGWRINANELHT
ncbi:MAG: hypothetical protein HHJ15_18120 [Rhodoferax sp.]|uniref:hypothetical protein n=1 Tax=Rhodoferax sp. TaxID=50421 RepID=UPI0017EBC426|nr:hypothetical protein [Rhodoferax sp.]NMM21839.1 hypothetical protein [Rhodoferax sp.]